MQLCAIAALLIAWDGRFTLVLLAGGCAMLLAAPLLRRRMKRLQRAVREENDSLWAFLDEMFRSVPILKAFCAQKRKELRELEAFYFLSGSYGGYLSQRICLMRKKQKNESGVGWKLQYFWHRLFPPFAILCMRYPKLKTAPWLLPYFWLCRLFDFSYWKSNFHREMATLQQVEQEKT